MAQLREQIAQRIKGSLAETEDFWTLCYDTDTGQFQVEHMWSHMNPYKIGAGDNGTSMHDADAWTGEGSAKIPEAKARLLAKANS